MFIPLIILIIYTCLILALYLAWITIPGYYSAEDSPSEKISVLIPARDEAANILHLLADLEKQTYPPDFFEVIVIDDHSRDRTLDIVRQFQDKRRLDLKVIRATGMGKKRALKEGIEAAKGDLIITTDADCRVQERWLETMAGFVASRDLKMAIGPVAIMGDKSLFSQMQVIEFASLIGSGAASFRLGVPSMCNGANLSFRKEVFYEVGGYEGNMHIASGDDEFLMHKIQEKYPGKVRFLKSSAAVVQTGALNSWKELVQQRKRWASKWSHYRSIKTKLLALFVFIANLAMVAGLIILPFESKYGTLFLAVVGIKVFIELIFLKNVVHFGGQRFNIPVFLILEIFYPLYVSFFGILSKRGKYMWKDRKVM